MSAPRGLEHPVKAEVNAKVKVVMVMAKAMVNAVKAMVKAIRAMVKAIKTLEKLNIIQVRKNSTQHISTHS